jgi:hypothetical protein
MKRQPVWLPVLVLLTLGTAGDVRAAAQRDTQSTRPQPVEVRLTGEVTEIHASRVFTVRERGDGRELLVLAPRPLQPGFVGATVTVEGTLRRLTDAEVRRDVGLGELTGRTRERFIRGPVLVAQSVLAMGKGTAPPAVEEAPPAPAMETLAPPVTRARTPREPAPIALRPTMLVANLDVFAGREVRLLNGHVVGVLEPGAFLVEPETPYLKAMGQRDRVLILTGPSGLRVPQELFVGATVTVTGIARTLLGMQMTREAQWPARLRPEVAERLEVRAVVLARSVQTLDGTELTERPADTRGR